MISKSDFFKNNSYDLLVKACAVLALVSLGHSIVTEDWKSMIGFALMLGIGALIQWRGEASYAAYVNSVNKNPKDDLK